MLYLKQLDTKYPILLLTKNMIYEINIKLHRLQSIFDDDVIVGDDDDECIGHGDTNNATQDFIE